jgi:hypothetical protein
LKTEPTTIELQRLQLMVEHEQVKTKRIKTEQEQSIMRRISTQGLLTYQIIGEEFLEKPGRPIEEFLEGIPGITLDQLPVRFTEFFPLPDNSEPKKQGLGLKFLQVRSLHQINVPSTLNIKLLVLHRCYVKTLFMKSMIHTKLGNWITINQIIQLLENMQHYVGFRPSCS